MNVSSKTKQFKKRINEYESNTNIHLIKKSPVIVKVSCTNLKQFSTLIKKSNLFQDSFISTCFNRTIMEICSTIPTIKTCYFGTEEAIFLLNDYESINSSTFLQNNLQKLSSYFSSLFTIIFNDTIRKQIFSEISSCSNETTEELYLSLKNSQTLLFTAHSFNLPLHELINYFIAQQRRSLELYSYKENLKYFNKQEEVIDLIISETKIPLPPVVKTLEKYGCFFRKIIVELEINKDLPEEAISFYTKHELDIPEQVERRKWIIDSKSQKIESNKEYYQQFIN